MDTKTLYKWLLRSGTTPVGYLTYDGKWRWEYHPDVVPGQFKLGEFPRVDKIYESERLWLTFANRIPDNIPDKELSLPEQLSKYGEYTVTTHYVLIFIERV